MRSAILHSLAASMALAAAEDILFPQILPNFVAFNNEYIRAQALNITTKIVELDVWYNMTTDDFKQYRAIVIADTVSSDRSLLHFLNDTKEIWGPAVEGNMIAIGTDPSNHCCTPGGGPQTLIDNALQFVIAGTDAEGASQTGFYMAMAYYYDSPESVEDGYVEPLSYFGNFTMRSADCYNDVHIVANSTALTTLTDDSLSNWFCSIHEAFTAYPPGFQALAIARNATGPGSKTFGDLTFGLPYVISRGATPVACGNGFWDNDLGEECDDGNTSDGDGCDKSCNCEVGYRSDGNGKCISEAPECPLPDYPSVPSETPTMPSVSSLPGYGQY